MLFTKKTTKPKLSEDDSFDIPNEINEFQAEGDPVSKNDSTETYENVKTATVDTETDTHIDDAQVKVCQLSNTIESVDEVDFLIASPLPSHEQSKAAISNDSTDLSEDSKKTNESMINSNIAHPAQNKKIQRELIREKAIQEHQEHSCDDQSDINSLNDDVSNNEEISIYEDVVIRYAYSKFNKILRPYLNFIKRSGNTYSSYLLFALISYFNFV